MKSSNGKGNAAEKANLGNGKGNGNGPTRGLGAFRKAEPLLDCGHWGVNFFGAGPSPLKEGPQENDVPKETKWREKPSPRPKNGEAHPEFEVLADRTFAPTEERCAW